MKTSLFYLPSVGTKADIEAGGAGLRPELYQAMLREVTEQAQLADELGYDSISFTEHHFHVEGFELSNNPILLDLYIAMQTKRIRVGQLATVLPANNPVQIAENIAMLDHMTGGRANAGFARGYQRRWVDTMAQQLHGISGAQPHQHDAIDAANREAFEECFDIIKQCWTQDYVSHKGRFWQVPVNGTPWDLEATRLFGGGVENGEIAAVAPVPKPLQKPHPPIFQPFTSSERTVRWCAREGITPILPPMHPKIERRLIEVYAEESGRPPGEGVGVLRDVVVADTDEEAVALWVESGAFVGAMWFAPFHFGDALPDPDTGEAPDMFGEGLAFVGSVDTVTRQLERLLDRLPAQWVFAWTYNGLIPHRRLLSSIEAFQTKVVPRVATVDGS